MTVTQACYLAALLRHSAAEDMSRINPFDDNNHDLLTPYPDFTYGLIRNLFSAEIIAIDPDSNTECMQLLENRSVNFYLNEVYWLVTYGDNYGSLGQFYENLDESLPLIAYENPEEFSELMRTISLYECLSYLEYSLNKHGLKFSPGEKTKQVINLCLRDYSVAQIYNFIWRAGRDAAAYYMRENIPKKQAANSVVSRIDKARERSLANDWDVKPYRRDFNLPQSALSRVVFNTILKTDDGGFTMKLKEFEIN